MSSWQSYIDDQILKYVESKLAIIASLQDGSIWSKQNDSQVNVTQEELKRISDTMKARPEAFNEGGIHLGGEKYVCLFASPTLLRGRKGGSALIVVTTKTCMLVVATQDGFQPGLLNQVVEPLGEYLITNNY